MCDWVCQQKIETNLMLVLEKIYKKQHQKQQKCQILTQNSNAIWYLRKEVHVQ